MNRKLLYDSLKKVATIRQLSMSCDKIKENTLIIKKKDGFGSINNSLCMFQFWEVLCYVPSSSILQLDILVEKVVSTLKFIGVEVTGNMTPEFYDEDLKAYMVSVEFRIPKTI